MTAEAAATEVVSGTNLKNVTITTTADAGTEYVILVKGDNGMWSSSTPPVTARTTEAAIRKHAETQGNAEGTS